MKRLSCDVAVIGAGSAGLAARRAATEAGARTLLIESGAGGTTCARCGCMPSKLLLAAARAARDDRVADLFGVDRGVKPAVDGRAVMARVQRERDHFVAAVLKDLRAIPAKEKLHGHARFAGPTELAVGDRAWVDARAVVIAVGARPTVPEALSESCGERVLTHESIFELDTLPSSLAVIGAGPLGLELAVACARLGVRVALLDERDVIGAVADPVVQTAVKAQARREMSVHLGVKVDTRRLKSGDVKVTWRSGSGRPSNGVFQYVLSAAGRPPSLDGLDLRMSGLELNQDGAPKFDLCSTQCGDSPIFLVGDANNARPVLHEATAQGELAGRNAATFSKVERTPLKAELSIVFTDPDIAVVGAPFEPEAAKRWAIGCSDENGRDRVDGRDAGVVRVYVRRDDSVIVGGSLFGPDVEHLSQMLAWLVQLELTVDAALQLPFYHPTVQEDLREALRDAKAALA